MIPLKDTDLDSLISDLTRVRQSYVDERLKWLKRPKHASELFFRGSGFLIILASLSIPFLSAAPEGSRWRLFGVPAASLTVAILVGLNSFFGWHANWRAFQDMEIKLEHLIAWWEVEILNAQTMNDPSIAISATRKVVDETKAIVTNTASEYFKSVKPAAAPSTHRP
jgi:hypothetical protein